MDPKPERIEVDLDPLRKTMFRYKQQHESTSDGFRFRVACQSSSSCNRQLLCPSSLFSAARPELVPVAPDDSQVGRFLPGWG